MLTTVFQSGADAKGTDARLRVGMLDEHGQELLKLAVVECKNKQEGVPVCTEENDGKLYSKTYQKSQLPDKAVIDLIDYINHTLGSNYNGVFYKSYNDGSDYMGDQSDSALPLDKTVGLSIVTYGAKRNMVFTLRKDAPPNSQRLTELVRNQTLNQNSVVVMSGRGFQRTYTHEIPIDLTCKDECISFTFCFH
jgi:hypothetical protein